MRAPTLLNGDGYDVMVRNLWRLLVWGATLAEARRLVFAHANVTTFPSPPASRKSPATFETIDAATATVH